MMLTTSAHGSASSTTVPRDSTFFTSCGGCGGGSTGFSVSSGPCGNFYFFCSVDKSGSETAGVDGSRGAYENSVSTDTDSGSEREAPEAQCRRGRPPRVIATTTAQHAAAVPFLRDDRRLVVARCSAIGVGRTMVSWNCSGCSAPMCPRSRSRASFSRCRRVVAILRVCLELTRLALQPLLLGGDALLLSEAFGFSLRRPTRLLGVDARAPSWRAFDLGQLPPQFTERRHDVGMRVATTVRANATERLRVAREELTSLFDGLRRLSIQRLLATLALDASVQLLQPLSERIQTVILQTEVRRFCQTAASLRHVTRIDEGVDGCDQLLEPLLLLFQLALVGPATRARPP